MTTPIDAMLDAYAAEIERFETELRPFEERFWRRDSTRAERAEIRTKTDALLAAHENALARVTSAESKAPRNARRRLRALADERIAALRSKLRKRDDWAKSRFAFAETADDFLVAELTDILEPKQ
ncbi:hypothetical protein AZL_019080 [Azospirillum sp. B510]|uniref:hypothetical protein n=1 Tax=Azospirillum sp. (strain B510) TaxID=137722 RepID=UPI0001C4C319|nr:hypothetical protein [Azospirillum sp. B510]BAI72546.1 hypothetical protein AZL_019080 [Azospirillum sp. B510]